MRQGGSDLKAVTKEKSKDAHEADAFEADEINLIPLAKLVLDKKNPRLPRSVKRTESAMMAYIAESTAIEDLMQSIAANGYFGGEPVIAVPDTKTAGQYVVVEGNRRLTALRLLHDPSAIKSPTARMREIAEDAEYKPDRVAVVLRSVREDVLPYLGFRHIVGVKAWEPLAKARYMAELFEATEKKLPPPKRYRLVARKIGSRANHIQRSLDALAVYDHIESHEFYDIKDLDELSLHFSVLSTALADERIATFVGASKEIKGDIVDAHPIVNPTALKAKSVAELTKWLFSKSDDGATKLGESRNIRELSSVVASAKALAALRDGASLAYAYRLTHGSTEELRQALYLAYESVERAAQLVAVAKYDADALSVANNIRKQVMFIVRSLEEKTDNGDE
jgi:hypothetical protein